MTNQYWSIIISGSVPCSFVPDVYTEDGIPPTSLLARIGDLVSWNNQTDDEHEIWITNESYAPQTQATDRIRAWEPSTGYVVAQSDISPPTTTAPPPDQTIYYYCSVHTEEHGTITVVS